MKEVKAIKGIYIAKTYLHCINAIIWHKCYKIETFSMLQLLCQCDDITMMCSHIINGHMEILILFQYLKFY
jgi:hypothetical protein